MSQFSFAKTTSTAEKLRSRAGTTTPRDVPMSWANSKEGFHGNVLPKNYYRGVAARRTAGKVGSKALKVAKTGLKGLGVAGAVWGTYELADELVNSGLLDDTVLGRAAGWGASAPERDFVDENLSDLFANMTHESAQAANIRRQIDDQRQNQSFLRGIVGSTYGAERVRNNQVLNEILGDQLDDLLEASVGRRSLSDQEVLMRAGVM